MKQTGKRRKTYDDLKVSQQSQTTLKDLNRIIVKASNDTGTCYGVAKCAEIVFERGKMVKGEDRKDSEK